MMRRMRRIRRNKRRGRRRGMKKKERRRIIPRERRPLRAAPVSWVYLLLILSMGHQVLVGQGRKQ